MVQTVAVSAAQERTKLQKVIEALNGRIAAETTLNMTKEQEYYVAGLSEYLTGDTVNTDLVLCSEGSLKLRVFTSREEAEKKNKSSVLWRHK